MSILLWSLYNNKLLYTFKQYHKNIREKQKNAIYFIIIYTNLYESQISYQQYH